MERTDSPLASIYLSKGAEVNVTYGALGPHLSALYKHLIHKQRCRPSTSVTEDTDKAPNLLSPPALSSTAEAGPRLPGAPTSPVPTPPAQVKSGEELSRGQGRQASPWISASGHQGTNPGPWARLCPSARGTKPGQVSENTEHMKEGETVLPQDLVSRGLGGASVRTLKMFLRPKTSAP